MDDLARGEVEAVGWQLSGELCGEVADAGGGAWLPRRGVRLLLMLLIDGSAPASLLANAGTPDLEDEWQPYPAVAMQAAVRQRLGTPGERSLDMCSILQSRPQCGTA